MSMVMWGILFYFDGVDGAEGFAGTATDTFFGVDEVLLIGQGGYGVGGAMLGADGAADTIISDGVGDEGAAFGGGAAFLEVGLVFGGEVFEGGEDGVGGGAAEGAEAGVFDQQG